MGHSGLTVTASPFHPLAPPGPWEAWVGTKKCLFPVIVQLFNIIISSPSPKTYRTKHQALKHGCPCLYQPALPSSEVQDDHDSEKKWNFDLYSPTLRVIPALWEGITGQDSDNHTEVQRGLTFGSFLLPMLLFYKLRVHEDTCPHPT